MSQKSSSNTTQEKKGFDEREIQAFMAAGQNLSALSENANIRINAPEMKTKTTTTKRDFSDSWFSSAKSTKTVTESGFLGQMSNLTQEDVNALTTSYLQRYSEIKRRRGQFGRAGLSLARD